MTIRLTSKHLDRKRREKKHSSRMEPSMKESGCRAVRYDRVKACRFIPTVLCTRATGPTIKPMAKVD